METITMKAQFLGKKGFFSRFFSKNYWGQVELRPDGTIKMTGYDKDYRAKDCDQFRNAYESYLGYDALYDSRAAALEELLESEDSPYRQVPFDMELCRSW